jgi:phage terminase Nu1 subunit (DNA packaging protein)
MAATLEKWVGPGKVAQGLDIDVRHVARLGDKGVLQFRTGKRGREYPWPGSLHAYLRYQIAEAIGSGQGNAAKLDLDEERAALLRVQRKREELKLAQEQEVLVPRAYLQQMHEQLVARLQGIVRAWPEQWMATLRIRGLDAESAELLLQLQEDALTSGIHGAIADADPESDEDALEDAA